MRKESGLMRVLATLTAAGVLLGSAFGASAAERAIDKEAVISATLDQAWDAWTTREGVISFFAPDARIEPRVGGAFQVYFNPLAEPGMKGADNVRFMALQPKSMISFDWSAPPHLPQVRPQFTFVVVRFEPVGPKETRVTLPHRMGSGGEWDQAYAYFDRAWANVLSNLKKRFDSGPIDWTEWLNSLRKLQEAQKK
jgi:uncharacterized protein YndB with AHSA1/START domain